MRVTDEKEVTEGKYHHLLYAALFFVVWLLLSSFLVPMFSDGYFSKPFSFALLFLLLASGYGFQSIMSVLFGADFRTHDRETAEKLSRHKRRALRVPACVAAIVIFFLIDFLMHTWMQANESALPSGYYDPQSAIPMLIAFAGAAVFLCGAWLRVLPASSMVGVWRGGAILLSFLVAGILAGVRDINDVTVAVCAAVSVILLFWATGQNMMSRTYRGIVISSVTSRMRAYNTAMIGFLCVVFLVILLLCGVVMTGVSVLFRAAIFALFKSTGSSGDTEDYQTPEMVREEFGDFVFTNVGVGHSGIAAFFSLLFAVLFFAVLIFLILRNQKGVKNFLQNLLSLFYAFLAFWFRDRKKSVLHATGQNDIVNCQDEERVLRDSASNDAAYAIKVRTYRAFYAELNKRTDLHARLRYAYAVAAQLVREKYDNLKPADTPRILYSKLSGVVGGESICNATSLYEDVSYGEQDKSDAALQEEIDSLCRFIRGCLA